MANLSKARGTTFETAVVNYLHGHGFRDAYRPAPSGSLDQGDVLVQDFCLELKATKAIDLAAAADQARREQTHTNKNFHAAVIKRRMHGVDDSYVVMPLYQFVEIMDRLS